MLVFKLFLLFAGPALVSASHSGPTRCATDERVVGFTTWEDIQAAAAAEHRGGTIILCPGAHVLVPNLLERIDVQTIQCGNHGLPSDNCVFEGRLDSAVEFLGITFRGIPADGASGLASTQTTIVFDKCIFERTANAGKIERTTPAVVIEPNLAALFIDCVFRNNHVFVMSGKATFEGCVFECDNPQKGGHAAIHVSGHGTVAIKNSCFFVNPIPYYRKKLSAGVYLEGVDASILVNENNYGDFSNCKGVWANNSVLKRCIRFDADRCGATMLSSKPNLSPSISALHSASVLPSSLPTFSTSARPSNEPTLAPSGLPSSFPSSSPSSTPSFSPAASVSPSSIPSSFPSGLPSELPTSSPMPSWLPSGRPSQLPSWMPSGSPTPSHIPSVTPGSTPSNHPSVDPSFEPSKEPSMQPSVIDGVLTSTRTAEVSAGVTTNDNAGIVLLLLAVFFCI